MPVYFFFTSQVPLYPLRQVVLGASNIDIKPRCERKSAEASNLYAPAMVKLNNKAINPLVQWGAPFLCASIHCMHSFEQDINR